MAVLITDIKSANWQVSLTGAGLIEEGVADIRQCIDIILRTKKGSDPLRPDFGSDIYQHIDKPVDVSVPNMKLAILEAIQIWEKRVVIVSITHIIEVSNIQFFVTYRLADSDELANLQIYVNNNNGLAVGIPSSLILEAIFPAGYAGRQLLLTFILDADTVLPMPPEFGFTSPDQMIAWVRTNWASYGNWYLLPDRIMLFLFPGVAQTGSLSIAISDLYRIAAFIPVLSPGERFQVKLILTDAYFLSPEFNTMSEMLNWVQVNWGSYGSWTIENLILTGGDFNDDFSDDFYTTNLQYMLVLYTEFFSLTLEVLEIT